MQTYLEIMHESFIHEPITREKYGGLLRSASFIDAEVWHIDEFPPEIDPHSWEAFVWKIINDDPPRPETIAGKLIASTEDDSPKPIPNVVRCYIACLLTGEVKQRRGPHKNSFQHKLAARLRALVVRRVERLSERLKRRGVADSYHVAIEHVAARTGFSEHTLDSWIHPRRR